MSNENGKKDIGFDWNVAWDKRFDSCFYGVHATWNAGVGKECGACHIGGYDNWFERQHGSCFFGNLCSISYEENGVS